MKNSKFRIYTDIFFGISLILLIFTFFFDTDYLFTVAYSPMAPEYLGGKTFLTAIYFVAALAVFISLYFKKKTPVYTAVAILFIFEIFNIFAPAINYGDRYLTSLFSDSGNLAVTIKTGTFLLLLISAAVIFSTKNKVVKTVLRAVAILLPAAFLVYEYFILKTVNPDDVTNFITKAESSMIFDFLRFSAISVYSFIPEIKSEN